MTNTAKQGRIGQAVKTFMSFMIVIQQVLILFFVIAVGFYGRKKNIIDAHTAGKLSDLLMKIILPFLILGSTNIDAGREKVPLILLGAAVMLLFFILVSVSGEALTRVFKVSGDKRIVFLAATIFPNSAFIGIPLVENILGKDSLVYVSSGIIAFNLYFFTYGIKLFQKGAKASKKSLVSPVNISLVVMLVMLIAGWRLPLVAQKVATMISSMTTPIALFIIGGILADSDLLKIFKTPFLYAISALRCFVYPALLVFLVKLLRLDLVVAKCLVIMCSCATATTTAVFAQQTNTKPELAGQAVVQSTLFLPISIPVLIQLMNMVL